MNQNDISRIQNATQVPLPNGYRELLLKFPRNLKTILNSRPKDARDIYTDAQTIIRWNKFFRREEYEYENSTGVICKFPPHHIVIGANGLGDFFHLNTNRKRTAVLFWCHETGEITGHSKDLADFVRWVFVTTADNETRKLSLTKS